MTQPRQTATTHRYLSRCIAYLRSRGFEVEPVRPVKSGHIASQWRVTTPSGTPSSRLTRVVGVDGVLRQAAFLYYEEQHPESWLDPQENFRGVINVTSK